MKLLLAVATLLAGAGQCAGNDYTRGLIFVNENQYGKGNGTLNYLMPDRTDDAWSYRVFRQENQGRELGCTPSFGAYHKGSLYIVSKFARDAGSDVTGGILTVADGATLKWRGQIDVLDEQSDGRVCGRAFLGIDDSKGYVSSSNGIWAVDLANLRVLHQVEGSENPFGTDNKPIGDPTAAIYFGQCGTIVSAGARVFAAHQSKGLLVIDPATDKVTDIISMDFVKTGAGIGSVIKDVYGDLWASVTDNTDGDGTMLGCLVRINPATLVTEKIDLPLGCFPPSSSWAAWTSDTFCASACSGNLFWTGGQSSWFANQLVYRYEIASGTVSCIINFEDDTDMWKVCCPSLRIDPSDDTIYMTLFKDITSTQYTVRSYDMDGRQLRDYPMERAYWFPGDILFPAGEFAGVECVPDDDNRNVVSAQYHNGHLVVKFGEGIVNSGSTAVIFDSAGRIMASFQAINAVEYDLPLLPGLYFLRCNGGTCRFAVR